MSHDEPIHELHEQECWERLEAGEFGRLAYHLLDEVHIVPINYVVASGHRLLFRTAEGSKLLGVVMHGDVAFEVDHVEDNSAWSVVARGQARKSEGQEARDADNLPLRPWIRTPKCNVVAIDVTEVTGRAFDLDRPSLHPGQAIGT
ncbi:MAG: pyridoxamine 5'-phosphate oxidase family protein [Ornithinimicrobium sp.]